MEEDYALGLGREIRHSHQAAGRFIQCGIHRRPLRHQARAEQGGQRRDAYPLRGTAKKLPPGHLEQDLALLFIHRSHSFVMVSSILRMVLVTVVQAASSAGSSFGLRFTSPTPISLIADALSRRYSASSSRASVSRTARSWGCGFRSVTRRKAKSTRFSGSRPAWEIVFSASTRLASTYVGSLSSTSACKGVLVMVRRAVHFSRSGASKVVSEGGGTVRFHTVYMLRR